MLFIKEQECHSDTIESKNADETIDQEYSISENLCRSSSEQEQEIVENTFPFSKFLVYSRDIYEAVQKSKFVFENVPKCPKSNIEFFVDTSCHINSDGLRFYADDCGDWDWAKRRYHYDNYLKSDFSIVYKKDDGYFKRMNCNGDRTFVKINPQPSPHEIFGIIRINVCHKFNKDYSRKISIVIDQTNSKVNNVAFFQYSGIQPEKITKLRTDPKVIEEIKSKTYQKTQKIYLQNIDNIPNCKVIENVKHREKKK